MSTCITGGKLASCLLLLFLGASAVQAQPVVISERLGEVIDADERAYFGLFPRIDAFVSATAHQQEGDSVVFVITQADPAATAERKLGPLAVKELRRYIDHLETLYETTDVSRSVNWELIFSMALPVRHLQKGLPVTVTSSDGESLEAFLLYVNDQGILLSLRSPFPQRDTTGWIFLPPHQIQHIQDTRGYLSRFVGEKTFPDAGERALFHQLVKPRLERTAAMAERPSPEVKHYLRAVQASGADPEDFLSDKQYVSRIAKKWHLALSLQVPVSQAEVSYVEAIGSGTSNQMERAASLSKLVLSAHLDYSLGTRVRLGAGYHRFMNENLPSFQDGVIGSYAEHREAFTDLARSGGFVNVSGNLFFSHVVLALKPFDAYTYLREVAPVAFSSLELRLGAGPSIGFLEVDQGFQSGYINNETAYSYSNHSEYQLTQVGVTAVAEGDFYVSRSFSIGIGLQGFHFPNLEVREYTLAVPIGTFGGSRKSVLPASSTLQYIDATVGVRLHF